MENIDLSELKLPDKQERILQSAIKLFSEKGFDGATSNEIAKDAGVAEGTVFKYFKTKKDILKSIIIHLLNLVSENIVLKGIKDILSETENTDIKIVLKKIIYDRLKLFEKIFPMAKILIIETILHEEVRDAVYNNLMKNALNIFNEFYEKMVQKGIIRSDIDSVTVFRSILANIALFIAQRKLFSKYFEQGDMQKEIDIVVEIILRGIEKR